MRELPQYCLRCCGCTMTSFFNIFWLDSFRNRTHSALKYLVFVVNNEMIRRALYVFKIECQWCINKDREKQRQRTLHFPQLFFCFHTFSHIVVLPQKKVVLAVCRSRISTEDKRRLINVYYIRGVLNSSTNISANFFLGLIETCRVLLPL